MKFVRQALFGKSPDPEELNSLRSYLTSELRLAAAHTRAAEAFNSAVARQGMKVLSGDADEPTRRQMEEAAAAFSTAVLHIEQEHGTIQAPEAAAAYYAAQQVVYGEHLKWARAQQVVYQSLAAPPAVAALQDADKHLAADKGQADKLRATLVKYMGISRHELNQMIHAAGDTGR